MSTTSPCSRILRRVLLQPSRGIVGLVDDLLMLCREHALHLDWQTGHCRARCFGSDWEDVIDLPVRKSVLRAVLARIAALCNEQNPNSVSQYGGRCELSVGQTPVTTMRVMFVNTPAEQRLELAPDTTGAPPALSHPGLGEIAGDIHGAIREPPGTVPT